MGILWAAEVVSPLVELSWHCSSRNPNPRASWISWVKYNIEDRRKKAGEAEERCDTVAAAKLRTEAAELESYLERWIAGQVG